MSDAALNYFDDAEQLGTNRGLGARNFQAVRSALDAVGAFEKRQPAGRWHHIDRIALGGGLQRRVQDPNQINQYTTNTCGVVAMVRMMAFDFPSQYIKLALDLYTTGSGQLVGRNAQAARAIQPSHELMSASPPPGMDHADWIVVASIRESLNSVFNYTPGEGIFAIKAWTLPGDVEQEFRALGYGRIRNKTDFVSARGYDNLMEASLLYQNSWRVVLFISQALLSDPIGGAPHFGDHWVGLNSAIVPRISSGAPTLYPFEVWTWASRYSVSDRGGPIAVKAVIDCYFGFVAGQF